jgi:hypothetical protein
MAKKSEQQKKQIGFCLFLIKKWEKKKGLSILRLAVEVLL